MGCDHAAGTPPCDERGRAHHPGRFARMSVDDITLSYKPDESHDPCDVAEVRFAAAGERRQPDVGMGAQLVPQKRIRRTRDGEVEVLRTEFLDNVKNMARNPGDGWLGDEEQAGHGASCPERIREPRHVPVSLNSAAPPLRPG